MFKNDLKVDSVFGEEDNTNPQYMVGDISIDDFGETIFIVNAEGTFLKTFSLMDLRYDQ